VCLFVSLSFVPLPPLPPSLLLALNLLEGKRKENIFGSNSAERFLKDSMGSCACADTPTPTRTQDETAREYLRVYSISQNRFQVCKEFVSSTIEILNTCIYSRVMKHYILICTHDHCTALQHTVTRCNTLQETATCWYSRALHCSSTQCNTLPWQHTATCSAYMLTLIFRLTGKKLGQSGRN